MLRCLQGHCADGKLNTRGNIQIIQDLLRNPTESRGRALAAVGQRLRLINDNNHGNPRIVHRRKSDKGGDKVFVAVHTIVYLTGGSGFTGHAKSGHRCFRAGSAALYNHLQHFTQQLRSGGIDYAPARGMRIMRLGDSIGRPDHLHHIRLHQHPAIGYGAVGLCKLQRCYRNAVTE